LRSIEYVIATVPVARSMATTVVPPPQETYRRPAAVTAVSSAWQSTDARTFGTLGDTPSSVGDESTEGDSEAVSKADAASVADSEAPATPDAGDAVLPGEV
jgi:hypothetical protein